MALQTFENDENNRVQIKRKNLKNEIRSTWLGLVDMFQDKMQHFSVRVNVPATTNNVPLLEF